MKGRDYINITGKSECTAEQMAEYLISKNPNAKSWALEYAKLYLEEGKIEGVRGDGAWIQSCIETGNFKFNGGTAVTFDQNNFCGLGVTKTGMKGHSFCSPRLGIRAQIQHLKGYATSVSLKNPCVDPRYHYITPKGKAPKFEDLAGKWAVPGYDTSKASNLEDAMQKKIGYGFDIVAGIEKMKRIVIPPKTQMEVTNIMEFSNSSLISYIRISPNKTSPRKHAIDTITIHCMAGNLSIEECGNVFAPTSRKASSNYGIGSDGRIALYVNERDRSWCSSNSANDNRAVTIEVANDGGAPDWHVSDRALASLIGLITDICRRNSIKELKWKADKSLIGQVDKQNMTVHRWFTAKACPGDYLYNKHSYIAEEVNKRLGIISSPAAPPVISYPQNELYRVRKSWNDAASQIGAYSSLNNAKAACKNGYYVFDSKGNAVYPKGNTESSTSANSTYIHKDFIKDVQRAFGAKMDGIASPETLSKTITISMSKNSCHAVVRPIQKYLNSIGFNCGSVDGVAGVKFDSAVKAFQKANRCIADGEITAQKNTWKKLLKLS